MLASQRDHVNRPLCASVINKTREIVRETIPEIPTVNFEGVGLFSPGHITAQTGWKN